MFATGLLLTSQAIEILNRRYLVKDKGGVPIETPSQMFERVAVKVASAKEDASERKLCQERFYNMMASLDFLPNSPTLMNAGLENGGTLSACYVIGIDDTMPSITKAFTDQAMIEKFGGGVGFSLSRIRPKGSPISSTQGFACGPIEVLKTLSQVGSMITQGGKRDGAHMAVMSVYHPDILEFISCKQEEGKIHNFNISVGVDSKFMNAVEKDRKIHLCWPMCRVAEHGDEICGGRPGRFVLAREIWTAIVDGAWRNGEPGMLWLDRINQDNATPHLGEIEATNPCGEQPLLSNESCNLGSINLLNFVRCSTKKAFPHACEVSCQHKFDYPRYQSVIRDAVRFLDGVVDINVHPTEETQRMNVATRKIGLGVMGLADTFVRMGIVYGSSESMILSDALGDILKKTADQESSLLAAKYGSYPECKERPMRNAWRLSIAPTGTISMIAGVSSGIEPIFALAYKKHNMSAALAGVELEYVHPDLVAELRHRGMEYSSSITRKQLEELGLGHFVTSADVSSGVHVTMQCVWQKHIDSGVSKTINLENSATKEDVAEAYRLAWAGGAKGITVYRTGSREKEVLVSLASAPLKISSDAPFASSLKKFERPARLSGITTKFRTGHGNIYVTVNEQDGKTVEVISSLGKAGQCTGAYIEGLSRVITLAVQEGIPIDRVVDQLQGISCCPVWTDGVLIKSPVDAMARVLSGKMGLNESTLPVQGFSLNGHSNSLISCPECSGNLVIEEGCEKCYGCGYNRCG